MKAYQKGTATIGTAGVGFVLVNPGRGVVNDSNSIQYSTSTYGGTTLTTAAAGVSNANTNSTFVAADIGPGTTAAWRLVGYTLKTDYTGTVLNQSGSRILLVDPTHNSLNGRDEAAMNAELQARKIPTIGSKTASCLYRPVNSEEITFSTSTASAYPFSPYMACMFVAPAGISVTFDWEVWGIYEIQGTNVRGQTFTDPDPAGFAAVSAVANHSNSVVLGSAAAAATQMHKSVTQYIAQGISGVHDVIGAGNQAIQAGRAITSSVGEGVRLFEDVMSVAAPLMAIL